MGGVITALLCDHDHDHSVVCVCVNDCEQTLGVDPRVYPAQILMVPLTLLLYVSESCWDAPGPVCKKEMFMFCVFCDIMMKSSL